MKLSLCIPTYNRSAMLRELLDSIVAQIDKNNREMIEICISDNASTDDTAEQINNYIANHNDVQILFKQNKTNMGPDRNYLEAVKMANGEYAWIIGSDDKLADGALERVLAEISNNYDVYVMSRTSYTCDFSEKINREYFFKKEISKDYVFHLNSVEGWDQYFNAAENLGAVFSYLSSIIFKREEWNKIDDYEPYIGTAYVHSYILLKVLLSKSSTLKMIINSYVMNRQGNDSFYVNPCQRVMLDYDGYLKLSKLFKNPLLKRDFKQILIKQWPYPSYQIPLQTSNKEFSLFIRRMRAIGYDEGIIESLKRLHDHKILASGMNIDHAINYIKRKVKHE